MLDGGEWVINGTKAFITNSGTDITCLVTVTAVTGERRDGGKAEISTIMVPSGTPGFTVRRSTPRSAGTPRTPTSCRSTDCRVPEANLLGERGRGYAQFLRPWTRAGSRSRRWPSGWPRAASTSALRYARERQAFGRPIGTYQAIAVQDRRHGGPGAHRPAGLLPRRGRKLAAGEPFKKEAAIAKLVSSNAAMDNARDATQIFGGYGFMNEFPVGRFYRDAKILEIGEGTSEVQRMLIARELGVGAAQ